MRARSWLLPSLAASLAVSCSIIGKTEKPATPIQLFDGKTLAGWTHFLEKPDVTMEDVWSVEDGMIVCKGEPLGFIRTDREFTSFQVTVEWRWAPGKEPGNNGVLFRIQGEPKPVPTCLEAQLKSGDAGDIYAFRGMKLEGDPARFIKIDQHDVVGSLVGVKKAEAAENPPGEWNTIVVTADGPTVTVSVNGKQVNQATNCDVLEGPIGLQSEGGEIHFRKVEIVPLP